METLSKLLHVVKVCQFSYTEFHFTVFSQVNAPPPAFISNLAWLSWRFFESAVYLGPSFFKKEFLFILLDILYLALTP